MIEEVSVKNFALIKEANIEFKNNLNVLTGETGSGKSILIGSINLALGKRASKEYMREDNEDTIVSICFSEKNDEILNKIKNMDIPVDDDGKVIIYRKITKDKNIAKINDMNCTLSKIKEVTEMLVDIYGQHDSEGLRMGNRHIDFLDEYIGKEAYEKKKIIKNLYDELKVENEKLEKFNMDEGKRYREMDLLKYEVEELESANLKQGEEEEIEREYKILSNAKYIVENLYAAKNIIENANIGNAISELKQATKNDESIKSILDSLYDVDAIVNDNIKELDKKIDSYDIDEEKLVEKENRLNLIRNILKKYNNSVDIAIKSLDEKKNTLELLANYEIEKEKQEKKVEQTRNNLLKECENLSQIRKQAALVFEKRLIEEMVDLGFLDVRFEVIFNKKENPTTDGYDDVNFNISLNKGEKMRNLAEVASGGELSRIMLSIKTILSDSYGTETLIFDEIDAGISGITAGKVANKLNKIAKNHQVICITHLPQIAAMADNHYVIRKRIEEDRTITDIEALDSDGMLREIGRLIGSNEVLTETVLANARELKDIALKEKNNE